MFKRNLAPYLLFRLLAGLLAVATSVQAQIYVGDVATNTVTGYNPNGTALAGFTPISLGNDPLYGLAVSGSSVYVADGSTGYVGKYTTAGTLNNASWYYDANGNLQGFAVSGTLIGALDSSTTSTVVSGFPANVDSPPFFFNFGTFGVLPNTFGAGSIAVSNNVLYAVGSTGTSSTLYRVDFGTQPSGSTFPVPPSSTFSGNAQGIATNGTSVFVSDYSAGTVLIYPPSEIGGTTFISGLDHPSGLAVADGILYVANTGSGTIGEYNALTGAVINASLISGLTEPDYVAVSAVPEPSSYAALLGAVALGVAGWRRAKRAA